MAANERQKNSKRDRVATSIPSEADINVYNTLDERAACEHFLGKTLEEATNLFRKNFLKYQEDLMWMGPRAFCFYVSAAIAYLGSSEANGNSDAVSSFCMVIEFRLEHDRAVIAPAIPVLREGISVVLEDFQRYECEPSLYGDVASRYKALLAQLNA